jgi:ATP-dependent RNA helicase SUPV3L1/SUV3
MEGGGFTVVPDMMSIVGCSGEDFQNILTSLGYRSQIRQVAKPVQEPKAAAEVVESETQPVESPAEPTEVTSVEEAPAPEPEMMDLAVWWPEGMGPFKARAPRPERPKQDKPKHKRIDKKPERKFEKPKRADKPMDPNSPFAALAALKEQMKQ